MKLHTRVFELYKGKYGSLPKLARAMEISTGQIYKVKQGKRSINGKFIIGAIKALAEYSLDDLFYVAPEGQPVKTSNKLPDFRVYALQKYPELDEDLITMIEDLIRRAKDSPSPSNRRRGENMKLAVGGKKAMKSSN